MATSSGWGCLVVALVVAVMALVTRALTGPLPGILGRVMWGLSSALVFVGVGLLWVGAS